ncbi:hypothetical protein [Caenimonas soli]|uniref:hypothetical protein n=1 Tax=Caenimonas soli TaxID=2735555 RepID=UPI0015546236|nr:hypothetical protein [Caenimonas soli]NPC57046.1 hypothetical protein [Caenimonas soli]
MQLHYLDFDFSDEESGRGSFDAMASVDPARLPALRAEVAAVLDWAGRTFGPAGALQDESEWDYELQSMAEPDHPALTTLTLTLSGSPAFCEAFRQEFAVAD